MPVSLISETPAAAAPQVLSDPSNAAPIEGGNEALLAEARRAVSAVVAGRL